MVWVLPCNFDARCHHGGTRIYSQKTINIFGRGSSCGGGYSSCGSVGFGGGFWGMLGAGLGMSLGTSLFNGLTSWLSGGSFWGGMGFGNNGGAQGNYGYYPGAGQAGTYGAGSGCGCNCGGAGNTAFGSTIGYVPGQYSITKTTDDKANDTGDDDGKVDGRVADGAGDGAGDGSKVGSGDGAGDGAGSKVGNGDGAGDGAGGKVGNGDGAGDGGKKPAGVTGTGDNARYVIDDIKGELTPDEAKEARKNFWKSIGAEAPDDALDKAWNKNRLKLGKDAEGNIYVIYTDEDGEKTAFKYNSETKKYELPNRTDFKDFSNDCEDDKASPININQKKNENVTKAWSEKNADVTSVEFDGRNKENGNCVTVGMTFGSWILNNNDESRAKVTKGTEEIFTEMSNGDEKVTFDEFIGYLSGYEADAMRATKDADYGKNSKWHDTVDMDAKDMVKLVNIFNKHATNGILNAESFNGFIKEMKANKNSNGL